MHAEVVCLSDTPSPCCKLSSLPSATQYWCEISSAVSLRPSIITPVLQPTNTSLPECTNHFVQVNHNYKLGPECAAEGSPIIYPCVPLPSSCISISKCTHVWLIMQLKLCRLSFLESIPDPGQTSIPILPLIMGGDAILLILMVAVIIFSVLFRKRPSNSRYNNNA